jgi:6-pyruvoyl-tetrahydropterin synthase
MGETMISVEVTFEMAHRCPRYGYGEESIHGHSWKLVANTSSIEEDEGLREPRLLRDLLQTHIVATFDHSFVVDQNDDLRDFFVQLKKNNLDVFEMNFIPTVENLAAYFYGQLKPILYENGFDLKSITLYEGPDISINTTTGVIPE